MTCTSTGIEARNKPGETTGREQPDEPERVQHRRFEADLTAIERGRPVEDLDRRGHRDDERQKREDQIRIGRLARHEHVVAPDEESDAGDRDHRIDHEIVAEYPAPREAGNDFGHHPHRRQDHDVDGRMRIKPEQVLKENRVATIVGVEDRQSEPAFRDNEQQRNRQHGRRQHHDDRSGVDCPYE